MLTGQDTFNLIVFFQHLFAPTADVAKDPALTEFIEKGCLMPMDRLTVKKLRVDKQLILPSKLFLKVKYPLAETFDKFNAGLAGGGHRQNHDDYESTSSPIVSTSSVQWRRRDWPNAGMRG
jgi:hypothetical protein